MLQKEHEGSMCNEKLNKPKNGLLQNQAAQGAGEKPLLIKYDFNKKNVWDKCTLCQVTVQHCSTISFSTLSLQKFWIQILLKLD